MLIRGPGNFENQWTTAVMSMMQRALIVSQDPLGYNEFHSIVCVKLLPVLWGELAQRRRSLMSRKGDDL